MDRGPFSEIWTKARATPHNTIFSLFCILIEFLGCNSLIDYFSVLFFRGFVLGFFILNFISLESVYRVLLSKIFLTVTYFPILEFILAFGSEWSFQEVWESDHIRNW